MSMRGSAPFFGIPSETQAPGAVVDHRSDQSCQDLQMPSDPMYERFAEGYAVHAAEGPYNALYDRPAVLGLAGDVRGRTVLDAGCGPGLYAEELVRRGARMIGFDASPTLVALAQARLGETAHLRVHDLSESLHWVPDSSIDLVVLALTLNYIDDRVAMLREFNRVLVPSGALIISTTHPTSDWQRLGGSYFTVEPVESSLSAEDDWPVRAWRRPLTLVCQEFRRAGFLIDELLERQPAEAMARRFPEEYARLKQTPAFIAFRLILAQRLVDAHDKCGVEG